MMTDEFSDGSDDLPASLLDEESRIVRWPKKRDDRLACLQFLASKFSSSAFYTEAQVNEVILRHTVQLDHALLRRERAQLSGVIGAAMLSA